MSEHTTAGDLRATSDAFVARLAEVSEMEQRKRSLAPTDPAFTELADAVEQSVLKLLGQSRRQRDLSWEARRANIQTPISAISPELGALELLAQWRVYEEEMGGLDPASAEGQVARLNAELYRRRYQEAYESAEAEPES
jgi:hypothetical protein